MFDFDSVLKRNPNGVLATADGAKVRTRVFMYLFADGKKAYFCTNDQKPVYAQLQANANASFCSPGDFTPVVSINGKAVFVEDRALKTRVMDEFPMIRTIYHNPDNPVFKLFYIDVEEVETFGFDEGPKTYTP